MDVAKIIEKIENETICLDARLVKYANFVDIMTTLYTNYKSRIMTILFLRTKAWDELSLSRYRNMDPTTKRNMWPKSITTDEFNMTHVYPIDYETLNDFIDAAYIKAKDLNFCWDD